MVVPKDLIQRSDTVWELPVSYKKGMRIPARTYAKADSSKISEKSINRGYNQIGTLGSSNHYLEVHGART